MVCAIEKDAIQHPLEKPDRALNYRVTIPPKGVEVMELNVLDWLVRHSRVPGVGPVWVEAISLSICRAHKVITRKIAYPRNLVWVFTI